MPLPHESHQGGEINDPPDPEHDEGLIGQLDAHCQARQTAEETESSEDVASRLQAAAERVGQSRDHLECQFEFRLFPLYNWE